MMNMEYCQILTSDIYWSYLSIGYAEAILKFRNIIKKAKCDEDKKVTVMKFQQERWKIINWKLLRKYIVKRKGNMTKNQLRTKLLNFKLNFELITLRSNFVTCNFYRTF